MDNYIGEIKIFAGNYAPAGWMKCDGSLLQISQYSTLFALLGTTYGGDGQTTFGLPDLRGRIVSGVGNNQGQSYSWGQSGGVESVTLNTSTMPAHNHNVIANNQAGTATNATNNLMAAPADTVTSNPQTILFYMPSNAAGFTQHQLAPGTLTNAGSSLPHENRMPFVAITYIISINGVFPSRN